MQQVLTIAYGTSAIAMAAKAGFHSHQMLCTFFGSETSRDVLWVLFFEFRKLAT
jgi:hypothetical protein